MSTFKEIIDLIDKYGFIVRTYDFDGDELLMIELYGVVDKEKVLNKTFRIKKMDPDFVKISNYLVALEL